MEPSLLAILLGAIIGGVLALTGAGGGVLAIPLLVFGLHLPVQQAAPVGLMAVGIAAALGAGLGLQQRIVRYRAAALIGAVGMLIAPLGVLLAQRLPNRPLLAAFSVLLVFTAWRTLKRSGQPTIEPAMQAETAICQVNPADHRLTWTAPCARALAGTGLISGLLSGLLGVGGGFVIIPALSRFTDLDIRSIQASSLAVIALVALSGVSAASWHGALPWGVALPFTLGAVLAMLLGQRLTGKLDPKRMQQAFAWLSILVALIMLARALGWTLT